MRTLTFAIIFLSFYLISCKKQYTCECTTEVTLIDPSFSGLIGDLNTTESYQMEKMKEKDAKAKCESGNSETNLVVVTSKKECEIKL